MARARMRHNWDGTSIIWATLLNINRDPKKRAKPFSPEEIHPFLTPQKQEEDNFELLRLLVPRNHG